MRGTDRQTGRPFRYAGPDSLIPPDHPLRAIRVLVNAALNRLSLAFDAIYAEAGRPLIPPEKFGLAMGVPVWDVTVSTKDRDRLLEGDIAPGFLTAILADPQVITRSSKASTAGCVTNALNETVFTSLRHARAVPAAWQRDYHEVRAHSALRGRPAGLSVPPCPPASSPLRAGFASRL